MNRQTSAIPSTILRNKLGTLANHLQQQANPSGKNQDFATLDKVLTESIKVLSQFYRSLAEPGFTPISLVADTLPEAELYNNNFQAVSEDLEVIFSEFETLETIILSNFNYMVSRLNRLNRKLKSVSSKMGDFILLADLPTKDALFFTDSFNNLNRVETNSPLLNTEECEVNQAEGIVTLPVDRNAVVPILIKDTPILNSNSNGVPGNNQELGVTQLHNSLTSILDNNADTWFEYERVVTTDDGVALVLDFTINLGEAKVVNFIRVNPNNFGTRTQVKIINIDTSEDGADFISIKDDIPIAGFFAEDEVNVFTLAPSTSKFAGQGLYTFTPRKAKYIHLTLKQTEPYTIQTTTGPKSRYAIGVRDVEIQALPYKAKGEIISTEYSTFDDVRKVTLLVSQRPDPGITSDLAGISHYVSPDNGQTWHQIRPKVSSGSAFSAQNIPELLDFNGVTDGSIATNNEVLALRYKAILERFPDAFTDQASELAQQIVNNTELHTPPLTTPFELNLQETPIKGTFKLIDPQFGSRGRDDVKYHIASGNGNKLIIWLPFKPFKRDLIKDTVEPYALQEVDPQRIYVDGVLWTRGLNSSSAGTATQYKLNYEEGTLEFGDGTHGKVVPADAAISMTLLEERLFPSRGVDHVAALDYPTAHDKQRVEINIVHPVTYATDVLKKGTKRHQLLPDIVSGSIVLSGSSATEVTFQDGSSEFSGNQYSVDYLNGVLYFSATTGTTHDTTVIYQYRPRSVLTEDEWDFVDVDGVANGVKISSSAFQTFTPDPIAVPSGVRYFNAAHLALVKGTVSFRDRSTWITPLSLQKEVEFVDGRTELMGVIPASQQLEPFETPGLQTVDFALPITLDSSFAVTFNNANVFQVEVMSEPNSDGEYRILRDLGVTGTLQVYTSTIVDDPGKVGFYYRDPQANLSGRYSINYDTGEVFTYDATIDNIEMLYEYTDIRAKYDIARLVLEDDYVLDLQNKKVAIRDREVLKNMRIPKGKGGTGSTNEKFYQVSYQYAKSMRSDIETLEKYFTPTLKAYALKVITKSRLV